MSAKIFRFVVRAGERSLASFNDEQNAKIYIDFQKAAGCGLPMLIEDQYEAMQKEQARRKRVERILEAVRVLKEVA